MQTRLILFLIIGTILISCDDILDLQPTDSITSEKAIKNETELKNAILGCYDALQSDNYYGRLLIIFNEISSDNAYNSGTILSFEQFQSNNVQQDNIYLEGLWAAPYIAINRCNTIIYYANKLESITIDKRNTYIAELRFLRALSYYNLTRLFKDIPLKLEPTLNEDDLNTPLSEREMIYNQILNDLNFADGKILETNPFYATDLAVKTLLAKVHLELKNYDEAIKNADFVLSSNRELLNNYRELFTLEGNSESIFELNFTPTLSDKNRLSEYCLPPQLSGRYEIAPEKELFDSYDDDDTRKKMFLTSPIYCNKYESITSGSDNVYIFRLAELYLLRAEARALANGNLSLIRKDINTIRTRAGVNSTSSSSYPELLQIIFNERRKEFAFEGHRWFDITRYGKANELLGISNDNFYLPIPISEINTNNSIN